MSITTTRTTKTIISGVAGIIHANWLSNAKFDTIAKGNLNSNDYIRYRCTNYPEKYDQRRVDYLKSNYKAKIKGLQLGIDVAYFNKIVKYAAKFKQLGFDFVEYNLENAFDGPNRRDEARKNLEKIRKAANAVHAQGMKFKLAPGRPNSRTFQRTGLLGDIAKLVDQYHIQNQTVQRVSNKEYSDFTASITKALRTANPKIVVTSQVSPAQGAQPGKTLQKTMRDVITAAMSKSPPGNTEGVSMWIRSGDVVEAKAFFTWFRQRFSS